MASVQSVVIDKIDAVVMAAAECVLKEIAEAKLGSARDVAIQIFHKFAEGVALLATAQVPDAPTA